MGIRIFDYFTIYESDGLTDKKIYKCKCNTHMALNAEVVSRNFRGQAGKAYLFASLLNRNVKIGEAGERNMTTGRHIVRDVTCVYCDQYRKPTDPDNYAVIGWKYDKAYEPSEKYKEGKFILEMELLCSEELPVTKGDRPEKKSSPYLAIARY